MITTWASPQGDTNPAGRKGRPLDSINDRLRDPEDRQGAGAVQEQSDEGVSIVLPVVQGLLTQPAAVGDDMELFQPR